MREKKFRAWDKKARQWLDDFVLDCDGRIVRASDPDEYDYVEGDFVLSQFTGLKDKNGVEIYEGYVVREGEAVGVVEFMEGGYSWIESDGHVNHYFPPTTIVVVGNKFENPELLEQ